ncbi:peptidoglycan-binding protein [Oceanobacillus sp. SE10311]|uniref:peptidoglycan-binding protein n=1 Tax=Oceanobacillus sp. SE10311 TaxID=3098289 RepID=UPI00300DD801
MIRKLITYTVIFFMIFYFSISGVNASVINNEVILSVEEETDESEEENLEIEDSSLDDSEDENSSTEDEAKLNEEPSEEETTEEEMTKSPSNDASNETDTTKEKDSEVENKASNDSSRESEKESEEENQTNEISAFSKGSLELPYKLGDNHKDVIPVKVKLNALGFDGIAETGNYGSHTAKRVKEFQAYYGLNVTGEVDQKTLDTLNAIYNSPYQIGNSNSRTAEVKKILNALGYGGLAEGPVFGSLTEVRVKQFQNDNGLKTHGIVDEPTYSKLKAAYDKTEFQQGDDHPGVIPIKQKLNALGFDGIAETGKYGSHTAKRVSEFQAYYGLTVTGIADQKTQEKLDEVYNSPYQKGNSNNRTAEIKEMLNALGYSGLAAGPVFGNLTEKRVKQFQNDNGLKAHGIVDGPTLTTLEKIYQDYNKTEFRQGDDHPGVIPIKQKLNALGFDGIAETGKYGSHTAKRVSEFQAYYGLTVNGIADQKTQEKLDEVYNSPYQKGNSNNRTAEIKEMLNALGYSGLAAGPVFGSLTEKRVKQFQNDNGLKAHGIVDGPTLTTLEKIYQDYNKTEFRQGDDHPGVIPIKQKLNALGFDGIAETGKYGSHTAKRVSEFQAYYGLTVNGIADQKTQEKLDEVYNSPYQKGNSNNRTAEIKEMLNALGYSGLAAGPVFGSLTEKRVKQFQNDNGLKAHGIVDGPTLTTLEKIYQDYNKTEFRQGDDHPGVIPIKQKLNALGFDGIAETGKYGSHTAKRVKEFQAYYGLTVTGIADQKTQEKLDEVYNSPYQRGKSNQYTAEIKKMLKALGYSGLADGPVFGSLTEKRLIQFQRDNDLKAHGIADEITISKLKEIYNNRNTIESFNISLNDALKMQMAANPQTDKYRNDPAYISSSYVNLGQKGTTISSSNVNLRAKANTTSTVNHTVGPNTTLVILGTVTGSSFNGSTEWYKVWYNGKNSYVHRSLVNEQKLQMAIVTASNLNVRAEATANSHKYGSLSKGKVLEVIGKKGTWLQVPYDAWRNATESDTLEYLDPMNKDVDEFQHLDLSSTVGATAPELNKYLQGKGILAGTGQAFIDAAKKHNINELYLLSHALLETGNGTSRLSNGITVNGKKVYNMFGIGAVDSCPEKCGSERAYQEGWDTPYKAIVGGAKFIGDRYIHNAYNQNTLYKMRWNPEGMARHGSATHQYATDIRWAEKQISNLKKLHRDILVNPVLKFNFVQYK